MPTIKTVKPAGGGDYTTLAAWNTFAAAQATADQWAECYSGNLGTVYVAGWTATPDASHYPRVYAAAGHQHNGINPTSGAYISGSGSSGYFSSGVRYTRLEGISVQQQNGGWSALYLGSAVDVLVERCRLAHSVASSQPTLHIDGGSGSGTGTVRNTVIWNPSSNTGNFEGVYINVATTWLFQNVSLRQAGGKCFYVTNVAATVICTNVVVTGPTAGPGACFFRGAAATLTRTYCASSDGTVGAGTGNLVNQVAADLFTDPDNGDLTPKTGSALIDAGADLSASFTNDILGVTRDDTWDIGAFMACAEINVLDGETPVASGGSIELGTVNVGDSATKTLTIQNTDIGTLTLDSAAFSGAGAAKFSIAGDSAWDGDADEEIAGGADTSLKIEVDTSVAGTFNATLTITSDDADEGTYEIDLTIEVEAAVTVSMDQRQKCPI